MTQKVLLVDDDEINRLVAIKYLTKWGVEVTIATSGEEAIKLIQGKDFRLILMDLHMPEMDGYECTQAIRAMSDSYFKTVPIIAFSASSLLETKQKAVELGMNDCLSKPLRYEDLQEKLSHYIEKVAPPQPIGIRALHIDFALHTDGDADFKLELIQLLIDNIQELKQSLDVSIKEKDGQLFLSTCHKVSTALMIVGDPEFTQTIEALRSDLKIKGQVVDGRFFEGNVARFHDIAQAITKSLELESSKGKGTPQ